MSAKPIIAACLALVSAHCGKAPTPSVSKTSSPVTSYYVCNDSFESKNGVVTEMVTGKVIISGSYATTDYFGRPCSYRVLDGKVTPQ